MIVHEGVHEAGVAPIRVLLWLDFLLGPRAPLAAGRYVQGIHSVAYHDLVPAHAEVLEVEGAHGASAGEIIGHLVWGVGHVRAAVAKDRAHHAVIGPVDQGYVGHGRAVRVVGAVHSPRRHSAAKEE